MVSKMGGSLLSSIGISFLIIDNFENYISTVLMLFKNKYLDKQLQINILNNFKQQSIKQIKKNNLNKIFSQVII